MNFKKNLLIIFLLVLLAYITNITSIPKNIVLFEGEKLDLSTIFGISQNKQKIISTSSNTNGSNIISEETVHLSFLNILNLKDVNVTTIENTKVIPLREFNWPKTLLKWSFSYWND